MGPYRLLGRLGSGGMGRVYPGRSAGGRTVAVEIVHPHFALDEEFRALPHARTRSRGDTPTAARSTPPAGRTRTALPGNGVRGVGFFGRPDEGPVANGPGPPTVSEDPGNLHTVHRETPGEGGNPLRRPRVRPPGRRRGGRGAAAGRFG